MSVSLRAATVRGCWVAFETPASLDVCGLAWLGALRGTSEGYHRASAATRPWGGVGAGARLRRAIAAGFGVALDTQAWVPITEEGFSIAGIGEVYQSRHLLPSS